MLPHLVNLPRKMLAASVLYPGPSPVHATRTSVPHSHERAPLARADDAAAVEFPTLLPHGRLELQTAEAVWQRPSAVPASNRFSLLSWNCLLPNGEDNWWCEKMYQAHVPEEARTWPHRKQLIRDRLLLADADIVCIQEAAGDTFESDFDFMHEHGYASVLHRKFRFRCATFYRPELFTLDAVSTEDRLTLGLAQALALALSPFT